jgi:hypothetical protein
MTKREALELLAKAHAAATNSGLFDKLVDDCARPDSINDVCDAAARYDSFMDFCIDHMVHFNAIPCEFEHEGTVFDAQWCWDTAEALGLTEHIRKEK